jgi:hypothetical protein
MGGILGLFGQKTRMIDDRNPNDLPGVPAKSRLHYLRIKTQLIK